MTHKTSKASQKHLQKALEQLLKAQQGRIYEHDKLTIDGIIAKLSELVRKGEKCSIDQE